MSAIDPADTPAQPDTRPDYTAQAIAALTSAARTTRTIGGGTETEHTEPAGFGEIACRVITSVAANLGGGDTLLAGRPGSWEADYVRQIVHSTTPEEELLAWRTEPVRLHLDVEGVFYDFGLEQLWDEELGQAIKHEQDDSLTEEQVARADAIAASIDRLWKQNQAAYREAYLASIRHELTRRGLTVEVEAIDEPAGTLTWEPFTDELHELARKNTPLPMTGEAPDWAEGTPADALHRAGLTYTARAQDAI